MYIIKLDNNKYLQKGASVTDCTTTPAASNARVFNGFDIYNVIRFIVELKKRNMIKVDNYIVGYNSEIGLVLSPLDSLQKLLENRLQTVSEAVCIAKVDGYYISQSKNGIITGYSKLRRDALLIDSEMLRKIVHNSAINRLSNKEVRISIETFKFNRGILEECRELNNYVNFINILGNKLGSDKDER